MCAQLSKKEYDKKYQKDRYELLSVKANLNKQSKYRLDILSISTKNSRNELIIEAIETMLEREGL